RLEILQQAVNQPADLSSENQVRYEASAVPLQQSLPYSDKQPMILSGFNGGNEQDIACRKACLCLLTVREHGAQTRSQLQSLDPRQSPPGPDTEPHTTSSC